LLERVEDVVHVGLDRRRGCLVEPFEDRNPVGHRTDRVRQILERLAGGRMAVLRQVLSFLLVVDLAELGRGGRRAAASGAYDRHGNAEPGKHEWAPYDSRMRLRHAMIPLGTRPLIHGTPPGT
jgi:hypothetical protein